MPIVINDNKNVVAPFITVLAHMFEGGESRIFLEPKNNLVEFIDYDETEDEIKGSFTINDSSIIEFITFKEVDASSYKFNELKVYIKRISNKMFMIEINYIRDNKPDFVVVKFKKIKYRIINNSNIILLDRTKLKTYVYNEYYYYR